MADYSKTDKFLHRVYLSNYSLAKAAFEMELAVFGSKASAEDVKENVFVTGLARSGTTGVMRQIFNTGQYASLQYSNMPFLLNPNLWKKKSSIVTHERAHKDGITIDGNSPEEFDEYFWKLHLNDAYIKSDALERHQISQDILDQYKKYIQLICFSKGKKKYISKNNNNILRLEALRKLPNTKIIFLFRHPASHASSLHKLHLKFSGEQKKDPFALEYFDFLGHHEFGQHHKPFALTAFLDKARMDFGPHDINYWLLIWMNYYTYVLKNLNKNDLLICFEDLMNNPDRIYQKLSEKLLNTPSFNKINKFKSTTKVVNKFADNLMADCDALYDKLLNYKL